MADYILKLNREFQSVKLTGVYEPCGSILECPACYKEHKNEYIIGWGVEYSIKKDYPESVIIYECPVCNTKSYGNMVTDLVYAKIRKKFGD